MQREEHVKLWEAPVKWVVWLNDKNDSTTDEVKWKGRKI
jgi:hypothetical protein